MSGTLLRQKQRQLALRIEATPGVDVIAGSPVASDGVTCSFEARRQSVGDIQNPATGPSYDELPSIVGGLIGVITATFRLVGSGAAATPPDFGRLLQICRWQETITAAAVGPTLATAGASTNVTMQTPWGTTLNMYQGMPILLTGNPAAGATDLILGYSAGRVASLARGYSPVLSTATSATIPVNVMYRPTSDPAQEKTATIYAYENGLRHIMVGCRGTWSLRKRAGQPAEMQVQIRGRIVSWDFAAVTPTGFSPNTRQAPIWANGMSQLTNTLARVGEATFDAGVNLFDPTNPEAIFGFDPPIIANAVPRLSLNPYSDTTLSPGRAGAYEVGTTQTYATVLGSVAGNRFGISCPGFVITDNQPGYDNGFRRDMIMGSPNTPDAGLFLVSF